MNSTADLFTAPKILLACGIVASLLKVGSDVLAGKLWKGYSFISQSISELSATGAPTRPVILLLDLIYFALMIAFAIGLWQLAGQNLLMHITAGLIAGNALISAFVILFLPMSINPDGSFSAGTVHVVLMATAMFFFVLAIGFGGAASRNWFRYFSFGIILIYIGLAVARFMIPSPTNAGSPVATTGVQERSMVLGYLLWVVVLAIQQMANASG